MDLFSLNYQSPLEYTTIVNHVTDVNQTQLVRNNFVYLIYYVSLI